MGIRVWNPERTRFDYYDADTSIYAVQGYDFILVRNEYNHYTPGLGNYIAKLEKQTFRPVEVSEEHVFWSFAASNVLVKQPTNIPFDHHPHTVRRLLHKRTSLNILSSA